MEGDMQRSSLVLACIVILLALDAMAQETRSEISLQGTGVFTKSANGNGIEYSTSDTGGFLSAYRYHIDRRISVEAAYGFDLNQQLYRASFSTGSGQYSIGSQIHQATGALVLNLPSRATSRFSPYILTGIGALVFSPTGVQNSTLSQMQTQAKFSFVYGGGVNYAIRKRISFRFEYRGLIYGAPDFGVLNTNSITHTAQPSMGITFRF